MTSVGAIHGCSELAIKTFGESGVSRRGCAEADISVVGAPGSLPCYGWRLRSPWQNVPWLRMDRPVGYRRFCSIVAQAKEENISNTALDAVDSMDFDSVSL